MNTDSAELSLIGDLDDEERDLFSDAAQTLLARTFIIRGTGKNDRLWDFSIRNIRLLEAWFACANLSLKRDEGLGVIALKAPHEMRARLGKEETCALLVARLLFEEKQAELTLAKFPSVRSFDFAQRYRAITGTELKKTRLVEILRKFAASQLMGIPADPADPEGILVLYPSIALTLDQTGIDEILAACEEEAR
jgi:hypothetical protein